MKITLLSEESIRLEPIAGPMTIEAPTAEQSYSPFHMVASGLAYCTFSVMYAWAEHAGISANDLTLEVAWTFAEDPRRIDRYELRFNWPSLPARRLEAARRVATMCTIHATFEHPPVIDIDGTAEPAAPLEHTHDAESHAAAARP
ncbi:MAG TPA: OsmC family protein [Gemmatimonadaceae bacterium]|nr:OsmC family protein [Gemmatimonadaceae bacterium]